VNCRPVLTAKECTRSVVQRCTTEDVMHEHDVQEGLKSMRLAGTVIDFVCRDHVDGICYSNTSPLSTRPMEYTRVASVFR